MTEDDRFERSLRDAARPGLEPGAADRIAAGAWDRAAALRAKEPRLRVLRRTGFAAAAAAAAAAALLAVRATEPAFAVEGDPVNVRKGAAWIEVRRVGTDVLVKVPEGRRVLRWTGGGTLRPRPGSLFRIVRSGDGAPGFRVEFEEGGGDVDGGAFDVRIQNVAVERDPSSSQLTFAFALDAAGGGPRVSVESGAAVVRSLLGTERLRVEPAQIAAMLPVSDVTGRRMRLMKLSPWTPAAEERVAEGRMAVVDAAFDATGGVTLVGSDRAQQFMAFAVEPARVQGVIADFNRLIRARVNVDVRVSRPAPPVRYEYARGELRVEVLQAADGTLAVTAGGVQRAFANAAEFRAAMPAEAAYFADVVK